MFVNQRPFWAESRRLIKLGWAALGLIAVHAHAQPDSAAQAAAAKLPAFTTDTLSVRASASAAVSAFTPLGAQVAADSLGRYPVAGPQLADAVQQLPELTVQRYGGLNAVQTVSARGLAANQVGLSLNGIPLRDPQVGNLNLASFYLAGFSAVEYVGPGSNLAFNPLGGNLNLAYQVQGQALQASVSAGSFGERSAALSAQHDGLSRWRLGTQATVVQSDEDYPFTWRGESGTRDNANFEAGQGLFYARHLPKPAANANPSQGKYRGTEVLALVTGQDQTIPGPVIAGQPSSPPERLEEASAWVGLTSRWQFSEAAEAAPNWHLEAILSHRAASYRYTFLNQATPYTFQSSLAQATLVRAFDRGPLAFLVQGTYDALFRPADQTELGPPTPTRGEWNLGLQKTYKLPFLTLDGQVRLNMVQGFKPGYNGALRFGHAFRLGWGQLLPMASLTAGTRYPAFNELYFFGFGNPDLQPEHVAEAQLGLTLAPTPSEARLQLETAYIKGFVNQVQDKILAVPVSPVRLQTSNSAQTQTIGATLLGSLSYRIGRLGSGGPKATHLEAQAQATWQLPQDISLAASPILPYTPQWLASGRLGVRHARLSVGLTGQAVGDRFRNLDNAQADLLPAFVTWDAYLDLTQPLGKQHTLGRQHTLALRAEVQNLTNRQTAWVSAYPLPGSRYRVRLTYRYAKK